MRKRIQLTVLTSLLVLGAASVLAAITYEYDGLHRLTQVTYEDGSAILFEYDAVGNRTVRVINSDPGTVHLTVFVDPPGHGGVTRDPNMVWYPVGTPVQLTAETGDCNFAGWSGDVPPGSEQDNPLSLTMDGYKTVTLHVAPLLGDLNHDADVDLSDLAQLLANYGTTTGACYEDGDIEPPGGDGDVDLSDLAELLAHYGETCP